MSDMYIIEHSLLWIFFIFMVVTASVYLLLNAIAYHSLIKYMQVKRDEDDIQLSGYEPPITIIIPAYNESRTIVSSIRSLLQLYYSNFELIVVNDGSSDETLAVLKKEFDLVPFPEAYRKRLQTQEIRQVYISREKHNLRVIDKDNGGKSDALNAGINISRCPLFCCVDADSILERYSLLRAVQPFIEEPSTIACGGTVRIANGCIVRGGHIFEKRIPRHPLAVFQLVEYLRSFLFGRIGWSRLDALLIISGAFGVIKKEAAIRAGGYNTHTVGEDMELIVRLHRIFSADDTPYRITFIPDPVCWTEAPESLGVFASQRMRWHRGLSESLWLNRELLFAKNSGLAGWLAYPFFVIFEWLSPFVEMGGYVFTAYLFLAGKVSLDIALLFFCFAVFLSVLLSTIALLLDEITFRGISRLRYLPLLFIYSCLECFGYRQINAWYRICGTLQWLGGGKGSWGTMIRSGTWQHKHD
ncbi:MAG TPA: glycosyltransferase [Gammaproteobacteria bacterium]|nr:glycosyltransferase [Gammaproteobacteria bacterium]